MIWDDGGCMANPQGVNNEKDNAQTMQEDIFWNLPDMLGIACGQPKLNMGTMSINDPVFYQMESVHSWRANLVKIPLDLVVSWTQSTENEVCGIMNEGPRTHAPWQDWKICWKYRISSCLKWQSTTYRHTQGPDKDPNIRWKEANLTRVIYPRRLFKDRDHSLAEPWIFQRFVVIPKSWLVSQ